MKKRILIFSLCALLCLLLALYSGAALEGARQGFYLWRDSVLPALLPFFTCAYIMQHCGALDNRNRLCLYGLSMVSGAPAGARLAGVLPGDQTDVIAALNAVSPMFICGSFAGSMLGCPALAWPILLAQFLAAAVFLLASKRSLPSTECRESPAPAGFLRLLSEAIASGMGAMLNVGGAILCFMALAALLRETGFFETVLAPLTALSNAVGLPCLLYTSRCV